MGLDGLLSIELGDNGFKLVHSSSIDDRGLDDVTWFDASMIATVVRVKNRSSNTARSRWKGRRRHAGS